MAPLPHTSNEPVVWCAAVVNAAVVEVDAPRTAIGVLEKRGRPVFMTLPLHFIRPITCPVNKHTRWTIYSASPRGATAVCQATTSAGLICCTIPDQGPQLAERRQPPVAVATQFQGRTVGLGFIDKIVAVLHRGVLPGQTTLWIDPEPGDLPGDTFLVNAPQTVQAICGLPAAPRGVNSGHTLQVAAEQAILTVCCRDATLSEATLDLAIAGGRRCQQDQRSPKEPRENGHGFHVSPTNERLPEKLLQPEMSFKADW